MCDCLKKIQWKKVIAAGFVYTIVALVVRQIEAVLTMNYYKMPDYFGVWSKVMMPEAGPPPMSFFLTSLLFSFITGVVLAAFYDFVKGLLPQDKWQKIFNFTCTVFVLSFVFFSLPVYLLINLPVGLMLWWLLSTIVIFFLTAIIFVKIIK